ncbi:unnamed protein product, partial [Polarella glacialis]
MGVNEALAIVQKMGSLDHAEFSFDEQCPFDTDMSLRLPSLGLQLCFDAFQQDLRVIAVCLKAADHEASMLPTLAYGSRVFAGSETFGHLEEQHICFDIRDSPLSFRFRKIWWTCSLLGVSILQSCLEWQLRRLRVCGSLLLKPHLSSRQCLPCPTSLRPSWCGPPWASSSRARCCVSDRCLRMSSQTSGLPRKFVSRTSMPCVSTPLGYPRQGLVLTITTTISTSAWTSCLMGVLTLSRRNLPTHERFSRYSRCFFQVPFELDQEGLAALAAGDALMAEPEAVVAVVVGSDLLERPVVVACFGWCLLVCVCVLCACVWVCGCVCVCVCDVAGFGG